MPQALQGLLDTVGGIVGGLSPLAKAVVAAVLPLVSSLVNMALAGSFDTTSIVVLVTGAIGTLAVYFVPNKTATPTPGPVAPVTPAVTPPAK